MKHENFSLDGLLYIHAAMRRDTARLARRASQRPTKAEVAALARWFAHFHFQLEEHHHLEDELFFPLLTARDPALAPGFAALEEDHRAMAALLKRTAAGLAAGGGSDLAAATASLAALIDRHLTAEEALVIPATARLVPLAEQQGFEVELRKRASLTKLGFALPWIASAMPPDEREATIADLPLPLRLLYRGLWRQGHARLDAALDGPSAPLPAGDARATAP